MNNSETKNISKTEWVIFGAVFTAAILSFIAANASAVNDGFLRVYFFDVGQGDAEFIQMPNGNQILIDGGPDNKVLSELAKVMPFNDKTIDLMILTHPHADHINGLIEVLKRYQVGQILENYYPYNTPEYDEWNKLKLEAKVTQAQTGQMADLGGGARLEVIYPNAENSGKSNSNPNNASVIVKLVYGSQSAIFTGDMDSPVEKKLVALGADLDSDFLKVAHHGSRSSTSSEMLTAVTPNVAFIEVGKNNRYNHPNDEVLIRLANSGVKYYRSDIDGTKQLILDGQNFLVK